MIRQKIKIFLKYLKLGKHLRTKGLKFDQVLDDATGLMNKRPNKIPKASLEDIVPGSITAEICEKETEVCYILADGQCKTLFSQYFERNYPVNR